MKQLMLKLPLWALSFLQSLAVGIYIAFFAFFTSALGTFFPMGPKNPEFFVMLFLSFFVFSAFFCGSLLLAPPLMMLFDGKRGQAIRSLLFSALWLLCIVVVIFAINFFLFR